MFLARLICSDRDCAAAEEVEVRALAELEVLACDCGCLLEVIGWPDWAEARRPEAVASPPVARAALLDAA